MNEQLFDIVKQLDFRQFKSVKEKILIEYKDPREVNALDFSGCSSQNIPNYQIFFTYSNIKIINLSKNKINQFDPNTFVKGIRYLENLILSENLIDSLDDLIELGCMNTLQQLDFSQNPVTQYLNRSKLLRLLFYPKKYQNYDPVKVLTAAYNHVPYQKQSQQQLIEQNNLKKQLIKSDYEHQIEQKTELTKVSRYAHKNTLVKYSIYDCPKGRLSRFSNLLSLNGQKISVLDALRAAGKTKLKEIMIPQEHEQKITIPIKKRKNQQYHEQLVKNYSNNLMKSLSLQTMELTSQKTKDDNDDEEQGLRYMAQQDELSKKILQINDNPRLKALELWQKPNDLKFKNSQYNVTMSDFKKECQDFKHKKEEKLEYIAKKQNKYRNKVIPKEKQNNLKFKTIIKGEQYDPKTQSDLNYDSDIEIRRVLKSKVKPIKPKLNVQQDVDDSYGSTESFLSENREIFDNQPLLENEYEFEQPIKNNFINEDQILDDKYKEVLNYRKNRDDYTRKIELNHDDVLPTSSEGLSDQYKFQILNFKNDQIDQILDVKNLVENSRNLLQKAKEMDARLNSKSESQLQQKKVVSYSQILSFLKDVSEDKKIDQYVVEKTMVLRDIIYFTNQFNKADEPKLIEKEIKQLLERKNIPLDELVRLNKQMEVLDTVKQNISKPTELQLKRAEQKNIERANQQAIMGSHYMRLKKYVPEGHFDKEFKALHLEELLQDEVNFY